MFTLSRGMSRFCALVALTASASAANATSYTYTTLAPVGAVSTQVFGINNAGQVVGAYWDDFVTGYAKGFVYSGGTYAGLAGPAGAFSVMAMGINDAGTIVGSYSSTLIADTEGNLVPGADEAFVYSGGGYSTFNVPGASFTEARGISESGRYIGGFTSTIGRSQGFALDTQTGAFTLVGDGSVAAVLAQGVNDDGVLVGGERNNRLSPAQPGFVFDVKAGLRTDIEFPGADRTALRSIDNAGMISGWYEVNGVQHGFTGYPHAFQVIDVPGAESTTVQDHNDAGWLVGTYSIGGVEYGFIATPVPEPGTWALMLVGVALLPMLRRRR